VDPASFGEIELDGDGGDPSGDHARTGGREANPAGRAGGGPEPAEEALDPEQQPVLVIPENAADDLEQVALELGAEAEDDQAPAGRLVDPAAATRQAMEAEQWTSALRRAKEWIQHEPSLEAVEKLIEISKALQDNAEIVRGLLLKGDLLIRDGELQQAVRAFYAVLRRDPQNETALRRMARFRELGVVDADVGHADQPGPVQAVIEARNTVVAVREEPSGTRDERDWMEIGALLDEFREGVKEQVGENDPQAHYDLGVSHQEMGLFEEALEEFAAALACRDVPPEMEMRLRELRGKCFARIDRHREAIQEFRQALEIPEVGSQESAGIAYLLGLEHAQAGEVEQAKECMREVLRLKPDFKDAQTQLEALEGDAA
jgi:tetratricopeptide (TPR) repeat protein